MSDNSEISSKVVDKTEEDQDKTNKKVERHCAYCLLTIPPEDVKLCSKCHRRAYCSRQCQKADWTPANKFSKDKKKQRGQGHKAWCGIPYGEEDLDWKVAPLDGKGIGLIALRDFPPLSRIMVDACQLTPEAHPATKDLKPEGGSLDHKFDFNKSSCNEKGLEDGVLCLRMSRANHSCDENAISLYSENYKVDQLFSEKLISAGEEIFISFESFKELNYNATYDIRAKMSRVWRIVCSPSCVCRDPEIITKVERGRQLKAEILRAVALEDVDSTMEAVREFIELAKNFPFRIQNRMKVIYSGFEVGIMKRETLPQALAYLKEYVEYERAITHPERWDNLVVEKWLRDPPTHPNYLAKEEPRLHLFAVTVNFIEN